MVKACKGSYCYRGTHPIELYKRQLALAHPIKLYKRRLALAAPQLTLLIGFLARWLRSETKSTPHVPSSTFKGVTWLEAPTLPRDLQTGHPFEAPGGQVIGWRRFRNCFRRAQSYLLRRSVDPGPDRASASKTGFRTTPCTSKKPVWPSSVHGWQGPGVS